MAIKRLSELEIQQRATIAKIRTDGPTRRRMMELGLVCGTEVELMRVAPFGDPMAFSVKGYHLSLRKTDANNIEVDTQEPT